MAPNYIPHHRDKFMNRFVFSTTLIAIGLTLAGFFTSSLLTQGIAMGCLVTNGVIYSSHLIGKYILD